MIKNIKLKIVCLECGIKNTFGILVYSEEYTFPILSYTRSVYRYS
jgi:hypothetical protein